MAVDPQRFHKLAELFEAAWRTPRAEREQFLTGACAGDGELRARVDSLLIHYENSGDPLHSNWLADAAADPRLLSELSRPLPLPPGERGADYAFALPFVIDRYELLERIGEGGFGEVFRARQTTPIVRDVALKLIKPGMDSRQIVARFDAERQALALMDHPGIARVFDAGTSSAGRPYFVMELVRGVPIIQYAKEQNLDLRARVALFARVCHAVQHAHQKGIIHRDLKPSNILVEEESTQVLSRESTKNAQIATVSSLRASVPSGVRAFPKIIDFGIAKATQEPLTELTLETLAGHLVGTPTYMSPEQVDLRTADVDTRSDIYALGIVLYELLCGTLPFDVAALARGGLPELLRTIREVDPPPPGAHAPSVRGELDWIVLKCLEKDRTRRYQSASALADDLERFLRDDPVAARPQTALYRARKFVRRNRILVTAVAALFLALALGVASTSWQAVRASRERDRASEQAVRARETAGLLTRVIQSVNPEFARGTTPTVREMLDAAARDLEADRAVHPLVAADAHATFAAAYLSLAQYGRSETHARRAVEIRTARLGADDPETLDATNTLIRALSNLDQDDAAVTIARTALGAARARLGTEHPTSIGLGLTYAFALSNVTGVDQSALLALSRENYERSVAAFGPDDPRSLHAESDHAVDLLRADQFDESERMLRRVLEARRRTLPADHPLLLTSLKNVMAVLDQRANPAAARELAGELVETAGRILGEDDPRTARYLLDLTQLDSRLGRPSEAVVSGRRALQISATRLGPCHSQTLEARGVVAAGLIALGRLEEAAPLVTEQYDLTHAEFGSRHEHTIQAIALGFDLAQARGDVTEMRRWTEALRGTHLEAAAFEQLRAAESATTQPVASQPAASQPAEHSRAE